MATSNETAAVSKDDIIIAVMGATGAGKSSFVSLAIGDAYDTIGHGLESHTQKVRGVRCRHPNDPNRNIVFLDTPGFDDTYRSDIDILIAISDWLRTTYAQGIMLAGLLFLHRISDNRIPGSVQRNTRMFELLCGTIGLPNVILVTTMWDDVQEDIGSRREDELRNEFWHSMISCGSRMERFHHSRESAWEILDRFPGIRLPVQLQIEMVVEGKTLVQTSAGSFLSSWLDTLVKQFQTLIAWFRSMLRRTPKGSKPPPDIIAEKKAAEKECKQTIAEQKRLTRLGTSRSPTLSIVSAISSYKTAPAPSPTSTYDTSTARNSMILTTSATASATASATTLVTVTEPTLTKPPLFPGSQSCAVSRHDHPGSGISGQTMTPTTMARACAKEYSNHGTVMSPSSTSLPVPGSARKPRISTPSAVTTSPPPRTTSSQRLPKMQPSSVPQANHSDHERRDHNIAVAAKDIPTISSVPVLGTVLSLTTEVVKSIEALEQAERSAVTLASHACHFSEAVTEQEPISADVAGALGDLHRELQCVKAVLNRIKRTGSLPSDDAVFLTCDRNFQTVSDLISAKSTTRKRQRLHQAETQSLFRERGQPSRDIHRTPRTSTGGKAHTV